MSGGEFDAPEAVSEKRADDDGSRDAALLDELRLRIAELDAIAWNLPSRKAELYLALEDWPGEPPGLEPAA